MQKELLCDLLGNYDLHHIDSISQGRRILRDFLPRLPPIFIVLDDVDNMNQIESLVDVDAVASGSLILITSRDKDLLRRSSAKTVVYDVKTLHKKHARELFCRHAFSQSKPSEELDDLIEGFLKICGGVAFVLKSFGRTLIQPVRQRLLGAAVGKVVYNNAKLSKKPSTSKLPGYVCSYM